MAWSCAYCVRSFFYVYRMMDQDSIQITNLATFVKEVSSRMMLITRLPNNQCVCYVCLLLRINSIVWSSSWHIWRWIHMNLCNRPRMVDGLMVEANSQWMIICIIVVCVCVFVFISYHSYCLVCYHQFVSL